MEPQARKILVVDDNQEIVDIISKVLRSKDFKVSIALKSFLLNTFEMISTIY